MCGYIHLNGANESKDMQKSKFILSDKSHQILIICKTIVGKVSGTIVIVT